MTDDKMLEMVAQIVSAHVAHTETAAGDLPQVIRSVHQALEEARAGAKPASPARLTPAVPIKRSVFPDYIICLEDGREMKSLRRHLEKAYGMTPDDYRKKWGLPDDYPMVAPAYSARRSELARAGGLGKRGGVAMSALGR